MQLRQRQIVRQQGQLGHLEDRVVGLVEGNPLGHASRLEVDVCVCTCLNRHSTLLLAPHRSAGRPDLTLTFSADAGLSGHVGNYASFAGVQDGSVPPGKGARCMLGAARHWSCKKMSGTPKTPAKDA